MEQIYVNRKQHVHPLCFLLKSPLFPFLFIRDTCMLNCTLHSWDQCMVQQRKVCANPDPDIRLIISWHQLLRLLSVDGKLRWVWGIGELILTGKQKYSEKNLCQCHFSLICIAREEYSVTVSMHIFIHLHDKELSTAQIKIICVEGLFLGLYTVWVMCFPTQQRNILHLFSCYLSVNEWKLEKIRPDISLEEGEV